MSKRKFKWLVWDYDCCGISYVIAQGECPRREDVPQYIVDNDRLSLDALNLENGPYLKTDDVETAWCKYQVRTDWENGDGVPRGGYCVEKNENIVFRMNGKIKQGWFPVWIVRRGEWC